MEGVAMSSESSVGVLVAERVSGRHGVLVDSLLVLLGSLVMAGLAQLSIPLPFTPVPITGQTLGVLLVGASLGAWRGASALTLYLVEGSIGLPFFAGGASGVGALLGPTGGYLIGFVAAAFVVGLLAERQYDRSVRWAVLTFALGVAVVYLFGVPWLGRFVGGEKALIAGFLPFLPGACIKAALAALLLPSAWKFVHG